jgi:hypothetical protein
MRVLAVSALLVLGGPAPAALAGVDLKTLPRAGFAGSDSAEVAAVGDVNGDGRTDLASSLQSDLTNAESTSLSEVAVVAFGGGPADPSRPGFAGWIVSHLDEPALAEGGGYATGGGVAGVGDWDGDGLADVAIGAAGAGANRRAGSGTVYVVLGRSASGPIDVRSAPGVIRIDGPKRGAQIGRVIAPAGDIDGDGRPDLVIGLPGEAAVVVRGGVPAGTAIDLANPPAGATIPIRGLEGGTTERSPGEPAPIEVAAFAAVGDVDGDGRGDLLAGVPAQDRLRDEGRAFVLRGAPAGGTIDAAAPLAHVLGPEYQSGFGGAVAAVPDSDGDGRPEWLIGSSSPNGTFLVGDGGVELLGGAVMVFSHARGPVPAGGRNQPLVVVDTRGLGDEAGHAVAGVPDQTGDGVPDLLIGLPDTSPSCRARAGSIALVPGRRTPGTVRVGRTTPRIDGPSVGAAVGSAFAFAPGELFLGTVPFERSARLDLWRVGLGAFTTPSPALPKADDCLKVTIQRRTRAQLRRDPVLHARIRSNAGDGRRHRVLVELVAADGERGFERRVRVLRLPATGTRRLTVRLPAAVQAILRDSRDMNLYITAEQHVGAGIRESTGAFSGDGLRFR